MLQAAHHLFELLVQALDEHFLLAIVQLLEGVMRLRYELVDAAVVGINGFALLT